MVGSSIRTHISVKEVVLSGWTGSAALGRNTVYLTARTTPGVATTAANLRMSGSHVPSQRKRKVEGDRRCVFSLVPEGGPVCVTLSPRFEL